MVANKNSTRIIVVVMAVAVVLCLLAVASANKLTKMFGGTGVTMEYETKLFDTSEVMDINIQMDEDSWNSMLSNALSEEYYVCDVVINGKRVNNVAIRPKGNTSLSSIAMDPDSNRYSLKLEFDHFVDGQTCYGLDKLILNNNYADATNMKEAVVYDMYQYLGADASLYNYAKVSVNGEYWGVYIALEGVEQSFMLRNYGTRDGELYKPDTMEMGGGDNDSSGFSAPGGMGFGGFDASDVDPSDFEGMTPPSGGNFPMLGGNTSADDDASGETSEEEGNTSSDSDRPQPPSGGFPGGNGGGFDPNNMPNVDSSEMPEGFTPGPGSGGMPDFDPSTMTDFDPSSMPSFDNGNSPTDDGSGSGESSRPDRGGFDASGFGGFSMGNGGANLNYTDDDPDSYSTIWDGAITGTSKADHKRVVTALKNISEGNELERYLDVDNVLKYMAVHTFVVNMDSLSGTMSHNYYLYEYKGQLNILPWDYNLSFGGMSMGGSGSDATSMVNDAIDTPFSGTKFFDALLENDEYRERYHAYLRQLVDEYVRGGKFDELYNRIRQQIDPLVEKDPTAFYSYEEYLTAADLLYQVVHLRADSIDGQLNGTIPSTDAGQREDSSSLIDASHIDVKAMGEFDMGGSRGGSDSDEQGESGGQGGPGGGPGGMPSGMDLPEGFDPSNMPSGMPGGGGFSGQSSGMTKVKNLITLAVCLLVMLGALVLAKHYKRR